MEADRRDFVKAAGAAALTTGIFSRNVKGANGRVSAAFIGMGKMGRSNLGIAMRQENLQVAAVCDIYDRNLNWAHEAAKKKFPETRAIKDFREILADKSIDIVCISTPITGIPT